MVCSDANGTVSFFRCKSPHQFHSTDRPSKIICSLWLCTGIFIIIATLLRCILCLQDAQSINLGTIWSIRETVSMAHAPHAISPSPPFPHPGKLCMRVELTRFSTLAVRRHPSCQRPSLGSLDRQKRLSGAFPHLQEPLKDGRPGVRQPHRHDWREGEHPPPGPPYERRPPGSGVD